MRRDVITTELVVILLMLYFKSHAFWVICSERNSTRREILTVRTSLKSHQTIRDFQVQLNLRFFLIISIIRNRFLVSSIGSRGFLSATKKRILLDDGTQSRKSPASKGPT
jgi:hypothetical protein